MVLVVDASIAAKWLFEEEGTSEALALRASAKLIAPDLLIPECANILWKKVARGELLEEEARFAAGLLASADVEVHPMRSLLASAIQLALELNHPAYDCFYLALAVKYDCPLVTADKRFLSRAGQSRRDEVRTAAISLAQAGRL